jgi:hypothetical protein
MESLAASTAYQTGRYLALIVLAALLIALIARLRRTDRAPRARLTDGIAALVVVALLATGVVRATGDGDEPGREWEGNQAAEMKAGFIAGCENSSDGMVDCGCAFEVITREPPYDTPSGFATLLGPVQAAQRSGDVSALPKVLFTAVRDCARETAG